MAHVLLKHFCSFSSRDYEEQLRRLKRATSLQAIEVDPNDVELANASEAMIGKGMFAKVLKAKMFGADVAIKIFHATNGMSNQVQFALSLFLLVH